MKLKEYLYYLIASEPVIIRDAETGEDFIRHWFEGFTKFADKTLIPKEVLNLEVRKFGGDLYFPGDSGSGFPVVHDLAAFELRPAFHESDG